MDHQIEVNILLRQFLKLLDAENERKSRFGVHPINQKRNISGFIRELKNDPENFYNYCRMNTTTTDKLLELVADIIKKLNTNFRKSISAEERLLITLR